MTGIQALIDTFADQQFLYMGPALPGTEPWDQSAGVYPVDWNYFPEEMTRQLVGYWEGEVPVYDLYIYQDEQTREIVILNADEQEIYSIECPYLEYCDPATYALERRPDLYSGNYTKEEIDYYIAHYDLARVGLNLTLVPTENLYEYLYAQAQEESFLQAMSASSLAAGGGGGGMAMMGSGGSNDMEIIGFEMTSGGMGVTVAWPATWSNRIDMYSFDGGGYKGAGYGLWELADSGLVTLGTNQLQWVDTGQLGRGLPADETVRFYAAGNADLDADGDGYSSGYEHLVLNTDPDEGDTDGDGISDGPFDPDNNGPIVAGPDPDPLNSNVVADTDGDGVDDANDPDDDNDGLPDGSDPDSLNPIVVARFKAIDIDARGSSFSSSYSSMTVAGNFLNPAWTPSANNMRLVADYTWQYIDSFSWSSSNPEFKFVANGAWGTDWGESGQSDFLLPLNGTADGSANIVISNSLNGLYKFTFHETSLVYTVEATTSTDTGNEIFEVSSSGRMLPYASGGDARGFGKLHGGIYFNNDGTNLTIGIAGFEKDGNNVLMLFIDADGITNGAASLASVSSGPSAFSVANNLSFNSTNFVPEVGILIGSRFADGRNYPDIGPGQGVYSLSSTAATDFPGFDLKTGAISQWGDRGTDSANAGIQVALSLSSLGLSQGDTFNAAAIIASGSNNDAPNRWFSGECYGEYVTGTLVGNDFEDGAVTLVGAQVHVSDVPAPDYSQTTPPFDEDDVMLQGYYWDVPYIPDNGTWYDRLRGQAESNEFEKFTMMWMNPPQKSHSSSSDPIQHNNSTGYDPFDYYDLGTYDEKFSTETRYGSEDELKACVSALKAHGIEPIVDLVFNHNVGGYPAEDGTGTLNFAYSNHDTFEKIDTHGDNAKNYYHTSANNQPFQFQTEFGPDVNISHWYQRQGLKNWGNWVSAKVGYSGTRWDVAYYIPPWFISEFLEYGLMKGKFSVMEFWTEPGDATDQERLTWLALTDYRAAMFDMLFHKELEDMCNLDGTFDMSLLASIGLINASPAYAVTFVESHDTIRPYGNDSKEGITKDKMLAYAPVLIGEGLPMIAYNDYFLGPYINIDTNSNGWAGTPLKPQIDSLVDARQNYAGGTTSYLSTTNKADLFIMKRNGDASKPGCILVVNDNMTTTLYDLGANTGWASTNLVDVFDTNHVVQTDGSGFPISPGLSASNRSYRLYVRQGDLQ